MQILNATIQKHTLDTGTFFVIEILASKTNIEAIIL